MNVTTGKKEKADKMRKIDCVGEIWSVPEELANQMYEPEKVHLVAVKRGSSVVKLFAGSFTEIADISFMFNVTGGGWKMTAPPSFHNFNPETGHITNISRRKKGPKNVGRLATLESFLQLLHSIPTQSFSPYDSEWLVAAETLLESFKGTKEYDEYMFSRKATI